jgi:Uma2 family endonuclease
MTIALDHFEHRVLLHDVTWDTYQALRAANPSGHLRMTYDQGVLEVRSPSRKHERISYLFGRMIDQWTLARDIHIQAGRNTTFSREDLRRGLEPDNCYWIAHEAQVRDRDEVDLAVDPPPDLALEVDVSHSAMPKLPVYAALGVPEVWRWRYDLLEVLRLDSARRYEAQAESVELPGFPLDLASQIVTQREGQSDTHLIQTFLREIKLRH